MEVCLLEKLRNHLVVVDPSTEDEKWQKMTLIVEHQMEFPSKIRDVIYRATRLEPSEDLARTFLSEVYKGIKDFFFGRPTHDNQWENKRWHGLDSDVDTQEEAETAIRCFPTVLNETNQTFVSIHLAAAAPAAPVLLDLLAPRFGPRIRNNQDDTEPQDVFDMAVAWAAAVNGLPRRPRLNFRRRRRIRDNLAPALNAPPRRPRRDIRGMEIDFNLAPAINAPPRRPHQALLRGRRIIDRQEWPVQRPRDIGEWQAQRPRDILEQQRLLEWANNPDDAGPPLLPLVEYNLAPMFPRQLRGIRIRNNQGDPDLPVEFDHAPAIPAVPEDFDPIFAAALPAAPGNFNAAVAVAVAVPAAPEDFDLDEAVAVPAAPEVFDLGVAVAPENFDMVIAIAVPVAQEDFDHAAAVFVPAAPEDFDHAVAVPVPAAPEDFNLAVAVPVEPAAPENFDLAGPIIRIIRDNQGNPDIWEFIGPDAAEPAAPGPPVPELNPVPDRSPLHGCYPIYMLLLSSKAWPFIPLFAELGIELGRFHEIERGGLTCYEKNVLLQIVDNTVVVDKMSSQKTLDDISTELLVSLKDKSLMKMRDIYEYDLVPTLLSGSIMGTLHSLRTHREDLDHFKVFGPFDRGPRDFRIDKRLRFLIKWNPSILVDCGPRGTNLLCLFFTAYKPEIRRGQILTNVPLDIFRNKSLEMYRNEALEIYRIIVELGMIHCPEELGFVFHKTASANAFGDACARFGNRRVRRIVKDMLKTNDDTNNYNHHTTAIENDNDNGNVNPWQHAQEQTTAINDIGTLRAMLILAATNDKISLDGIYTIFRHHPIGLRENHNETKMDE